MEKLTWTYEQALAERDQYSLKEMAALHGVSEKTITYRLGLLGLSRPANRTDILDEDLLKDYEAGLSINQIKMKYHCSHDTVTKRLHKYGIQHTRAEGIIRHFLPTYEDRWPGIKADLDSGMSITHVRNKYKIRIQNLQALLSEHGYYNHTESFIDRINDRLDQAYEVYHKNRRKNAEFVYLEAIKQYVMEHDAMPTRKDIEDLTGRRYTNVCLAIDRYQLQSFVRGGGQSSYVKRLCYDLNHLGVRYQLNNRSLLNGKEIDVWLPDRQIGIEINPVGTHSIDGTIGIQSKNYHQEKSLLAERCGISLVHLYDSDFQNEEQYQKILYLLSHIPHMVIGARKCLLSEVSKKDCDQFLNAYHMQGAESGSVFRFGLYYDTVLVGVMCFGKSRFGKETWELIRYCMHPDYAITGGFLKLLGAMKKRCKPGDCILSYLDLNKRFCVKSVYEKYGFCYDGITDPDYVWINSSGVKIIKRYQTTKSKLIKEGYDSNLTEVEIMRSRGYFRVFGAGSKRYLFHIE